MAEAPTPGDSDAERDLVVIGASAGGVETLKRVVGGLPPDLPAAICIVLHVAPDSPSLLARILGRSASLPCKAADDGDALRHGQILVAIPNRHLVVEDGRVELTVGPRENGHRPAVDVLFRSAAEAKGRRVIGVILSGMRGDGAAGLAAIKAHGGAAIVQDPTEALYAGMPAAALAHVAVDAVVPSELVASATVAMVKGEDPPPGARRTETELRPDPAPAQPGVSICPECGGVLSEHSEVEMSVWECRVGHRYSPESLADAQADSVEAALWTAIRSLEDRFRLLERMADQHQERGQPRSARSFRRRASAAREQAEAVRGALTRSAEVTLRKLGDAGGEQVAEIGGAS